MWSWILGILLILGIWAVWFIMPVPEPGESDIFPMWIPITVSILVLGVLIGLFILRRVRARRAARALEKAIAQQAQEQALAARPEEKEEIKALNKQILDGIGALKASKLGDSRRGEAALYTLPWYVIVGPPGAGKTTALRHSGLSFPYLDSAGGGVRGVGGTRNCDWWFTNEAILLDTAGRYTTETEDHDEWNAFLELLAKYRPEKPINGVLVAVSVNELLDASEEGVQALAAKVRARVDEMQATLKMVLPVYVTFTKTDLIAGFVEFFGDLKKSDRGQPWGATFKLDTPKTEPGRMFDEEFDILVEALHKRGVKRLNVERSRAAKERIYQFPLEFAAIKRNLSDFMQAAFAPGPGATPVLRGFYFTSGTQEGKPLDRVVGAMGRAFGLKAVTPEEDDAPKEAKSYFLRDVFLGIVFPDKDVAALSLAEQRRRRMQRWAIAAAAAVVSLVLLVPAIFSFLKNRELVADTGNVSMEAKNISWRGGAFTDNVNRLDSLRGQMEKLHAWREGGPPISYGWGMYQGDKLYEPTLKQYIASLEEGFLRPAKDSIERKVRDVTGKAYINDYNALKSYLLLEDKDHHLKDTDSDNRFMNEEFQVQYLTDEWAENLSTTANLPEEELKAKLEPHVSFYVRLQKSGAIPGVAIDKPTYEAAQTKLQTADVADRFYERFIMPLIDEKLDPLGPTTPDNLRYPPISLATIFSDQIESPLLTVLKSRQGLATGKPFEVRGPFTVQGHDTVVRTLKDGAQVLNREKWVVPFSFEEKQAQKRLEEALKRAKQRYEDEYIAEWKSFFLDIEVKIPLNNREAIDEFRVLSTPQWAYQRLLRVLKENTTFIDPFAKKVPTQLIADGGIVDQLIQRGKRRVEGRLDVSLEELRTGGHAPSEPFEDRVTKTFKTMVAFGIPEPPPPQDATSLSAGPPKVETPKLDAYIGRLAQLASEMQIVEEGPSNSDTKKSTEMFEKAVAATEEQLVAMDRTGQELMGELLMNPLRQGYKASIKSAGGAASGLWEVVVWPKYKDHLKNRYPFNAASAKDASYEEVVNFLKPKTGVLWGFYDAHLATFHRKQDHDFIPLVHLQGAEGAKAKPFTPFNPLMYNCLKRADEVTDALWEGGTKEEPKFSFQINLKTVSPIVSDVIFEIDGQKRHYRNEKEFWYEFEWPGKGNKGARMQIRGAGGLDEEIVREGPWGVFRLLESADKLTSVKDDDSQFLATWQMAAPPVTVTLQVRPKRANHPFPLSFFRGLNCPPSIGDKFGEAK